MKDLSPDQRMAVESLLGRSVSEQETVSIQAFQPPTISDQQRQEIVAALQQYFAEVDAKRQPVSPEEADGIINEAMRYSRPGYRPRQFPPPPHRASASSTNRASGGRVVV